MTLRTRYVSMTITTGGSATMGVTTVSIVTMAMTMGGTVVAHVGGRVIVL